MFPNDNSMKIMFIKKLHMLQQVGGHFVSWMIHIFGSAYVPISLFLSIVIGTSALSTIYAPDPGNANPVHLSHSETVPSMNIDLLQIPTIFPPAFI